MIRPTSVRPDELADEIVTMIEATARLGLSPEGRSSDDDVTDVLYRVQRRLVARLGTERGTSAPLALVGGRVSER